MANDRDIKYEASVDPTKFGAGISAMNASMVRLGQHIQSVTTGSQSAAANIGQHWSSMRTVFAGVAASIGLVSFGGMIKGVVDTEAKLNDLAISTGLTVEALSGLASVGKTSDTSLDDIANASKRLSLNLAKADEESAGTTQALKALGIQVEDFRKLDADQRMLAVAKALGEFEDGAGKTAVAMSIFGKEGAKLLPFMADLAEAGDLQAKVTATQAAYADNLSDNLTRLSVSGQGWKKELVNGMLPALTDFSSVALDLVNRSGGLRDHIRKLSEDGSLVRWTRTAIEHLSHLADFAQRVAQGIAAAYRTVIDFGSVVSNGVEGLKLAWSAMMKGDFTGMEEALKSSRSRSVAIAQTWRSDMVTIFSGDLIGEQIRKGMASMDGAAPTPTGKKRGSLNDYRATAGGTDTQTVPKPPQDPSKMAAYEATLAEEKQLAAQRDALREYTKQQEVEYWNGVLSREDVIEKDRLHIRKKVADLEVQIMRDAAKKREALDAEIRAGGEQRALAAVDAASQESRGLLELGEITTAQQLDQERLFEEQRTEIKRTYLLARKALIDPDRDPVEYQRINNEIEALEQQHQQRKRQIQLEMQKEAKNGPMGRVMEAAQASMESAISGMIQRTQSLRQAMATIWAGIRQSIAGEISKIIAQKVMMFAKERLMALAGIGTKAAEAGAGAAASQAAIPIVGPGMAMAAMAAVMGGVMALTGSVPSAKAGWSIPAGVNPMTQLHEREMVLPAQYADVIRGVADGGASKGGSPSVVFNGTPMPGGFFMAHKSELVKVIKAMHRDFDIRGV